MMRIRLAENFRAIFYAPFYATHALGFYTTEGIAVDLIKSPAPGAATAGLLDGSIDLSWGGPMRVMKARELDPASPLVCFCEVVARDPFFLVGNSDPSSFHLTDLPTLRVAIVSEVPTPWLCLQHDLREQGVDPERIKPVTDRSMEDNLEALRKGELDVVQTFEPYTSLALRAAVGDIVYAASSRGPTVYTTFLTTRHSSMSKHYLAFAAVVRATRRTLAWVTEHSAEELAAAVASYYPDVPHDILTSSLRRYRDAGLWARTPHVSRQGFVRLTESLKSGGFISRVHSYEDCIEQTL